MLREVTQLQEGEQSIIHYQLVPEVLQQVSKGKRREATATLSVARVCGEESVPWKDVEDDGKGQWQLDSPAREYLEQVKCCHDTDCTT